MRAVAAGVAFLDEHDPDWWRADVERAIDLDRLDIVDERLCVLGQRCPLEIGEFGSPYAAQAALLGSGAEKPSDLWHWAVKLGFAIGDEHESELAAEWARVIRERRSV